MSTATQQRLLTAEEFSRLPQPQDGSQQELVDAVIVTMPPPSFYHGLCCSELAYRPGKHLREQKLLGKEERFHLRSLASRTVHYR